MKAIYILCILLVPVYAGAQSLLTGKVITQSNLPLAGASVSLKQGGERTMTNNKGEFSISLLLSPDTLIISHSGYQDKRLYVTYRDANLAIALEESVKELQVVTINTGYQQLPKERITGSFEFIDNDLFNRRVSADIMSRLEGIVPSVLKDTRNSGDKYSIRGKSTIYSNTSPLIVVDNFPYEGNIEDMNPDDVENISVLKDAAAASIWGARAGNGVIVITTKKGRFNQRAQVEFNTNITIGEKPDLWYLPQLSPADFIEMEKDLFAKNFFIARESASSKPPLTPVLELLIKKRNGQITAEDAEKQIEAYKQFDAKKDFDKYLYRNSTLQQYTVSLKGGSASAGYFLSAGYTRSNSSSILNYSDRISLRTENVFRPFKKLEVTVGIALLQNKDAFAPSAYGSVTNGPYVLYPYAQLADEQGNHLNINKRRALFEDAATTAGLLDWHYNPLDEVYRSDNTSNIVSVRVNPSVKYIVTNDISLQLHYQYQSEQSERRTLNTIESYYTRNLVNLFTQVNGATITRPIPAQGILDRSASQLISHNGRAVLNFNKTFSRHNIIALAGAEWRQTNQTSSGNIIYGYDDNIATSNSALNYSMLYTMYQGISASARIPAPSSSPRYLLDRFISYFFNGAYTYDSKYTLSVSARADGSNYFGIKTNQRIIPLWSCGLLWNIDKEKFYHVGWLPVLQLKASYGYNGNINKDVAALTTALYQTSSQTGLATARIQNAPNDELRWERTAITNFALLFGSKNERINGRIEYYFKKGLDLIGKIPLDPTAGVFNSAGTSSYIQGNVANMKGRGWDVELNIKLVKRKINWDAIIIFSSNSDEVTRYLLPEKGAAPFLSYYGSIVPIEGKPIEGIYSYRWAGLDPATGDPQGYVNGIVSKDYAALTTAKAEDLKYNGPALPTQFGAFRNVFSWKGLTVSANIMYKLGYYFRNSSVSYYVLSNTNYAHPDYLLRWQQPGDEKITSVPSLPSLISSSRDAFYNYSEVLVLKGDHIRLQDIQLGYQLNKNALKKLPFSSIQFYAYINNVCLIWTANKQGLDPDAGSQWMPEPRTFSFGMKMIF